jgi:homoserine acetyltransferase
VRANGYDEISGIHDTEQLLRRLGVRNRRERQALKMELREALSRETTVNAKLESVEEQLEDQTERADDAEATLYALRAQSDQFKDRVAAREAVIETEANEYFDLAAQSMAGEKDLASRVESVAPSILGMLRSDNLDVVKEAAKIAEGLGLLTRDGVVEAVENVAMMKEETRQREAAILATVKRAKTPKKGGKKEGKETKGAKSGKKTKTLG